MADTPVFDNPTGLIGRVNGGGGTLKRLSGYLNLTAASNRESYGMLPASAIGFKPKLLIFAPYSSNGGSIGNIHAVDIENKISYGGRDQSWGIIFPDLTAKSFGSMISSSWGNSGSDCTAQIRTMTYGGVPYKCIVSTTDSGDGTYGRSTYISANGDIQIWSKTAYRDGSGGYVATFYYYILG